MANYFASSKRQLLKTIHAWIGIVGGAFLCVVALTGSVIVFRTEIDSATIPKSASVSSSVGLDAAALEVSNFRPESRIRRVRLPGKPGDPYIFQVESSGKRTERIVSDASTGRVLGTLPSGWVDWMVDLHRNLLAGKTGRATVGAFGVVLFVLSATGLLLWLSGARNWRAWISIPRRGSTLRFNFELHRVSGLWAYCFLAVISFTGVGLAYPDTFRQAIQSLTRTSPIVRAPRIDADSLRSLDEYLRIGRSAMPDGVATELRLPAPGKGPVDLRFYREGDLQPAGNHVYLNPATAAVVAIDRVADRPIGARFLAALSPIHYGEFGGVAIKVVWGLLGLTPLLLFATGLIAWWRPAKRKPGEPASEHTGIEEGLLARW